MIAKKCIKKTFHYRGEKMNDLLATIFTGIIIDENEKLLCPKTDKPLA